MVDRINDHLSLAGPNPKPRSIKRWDSTLNALLPFAVIQPWVRTGLTGKPSEQIEQAVNDADAQADLGNPALSGLLQVQEVDGTLVSDGKAFGHTTWRRYDIPLPGVGELGDPSAWVEKGVQPTRRFFASGGSLATSAGTECSGAYVDIPVPYGIFAVRNNATQTKPTGIFSSVGTFTTIEGASMMKLAPELRVYEVGTTVQYVLINFYEWRASSPVNGWELHDLDDEKNLVVHTVS